MTVEYILFDLDNTLYSSSTGLLREIDRRMTVFVSKYLGTSEENAKLLRIGFRDRYGTTLRGLMIEHNFTDYESFFTEVHPKNLTKYLEKDLYLKETLEKINIPKSVLTNSPMEHAKRVLDFLEVRDFFENIFDIRFNKLEGKPNLSAYTRVLKKINKQPEKVLFIDDLSIYLEPFRELGGKVILIDRKAQGNGKTNGIPRIKSIQELPQIIENL